MVLLHVKVAAEAAIWAAAEATIWVVLEAIRAVLVEIEAVLEEIWVVLEIGAVLDRTMDFVTTITKAAISRRMALVDFPAVSWTRYIGFARTCFTVIVLYTSTKFSLENTQHIL